MQYTMKLNSIIKCRKYCELIEKFSFSGYIKVDNYLIEKNDIQKIMENCLLREVQLVINICMDEDIDPIKRFLQEAYIIEPLTDR